MFILRQSTDSQQIPLGPIRQWDDDTASLIAYTSTVANTDVRILKAGATSEVSKNSGGATHVSGGLYRATLNSSDTDTLGPMSIRVAITGTEPVTRQATVLPGVVYDALVANSGDGIKAASAGVVTLLDRVTGLLRTKAEDDATDATTQALIEDVQDSIDALPDEETNAAAVLTAATDAGGIAANVKWANDKPLEPVTDIAKESSVQQAITAINGIEPGDGPGAPTGPGGIPVIIPVTSNNQPVDGVAVWITTDPEGTNQIAGTLYTNTFGNTDPPFTLEPGIFYVWVQKAGINFINPQPIQVLENGTYQWHTG